MSNANKIKQYRALRKVNVNQISELLEIADKASTDVKLRIQFKISFQKLEECREEFKTNHQNIISLIALTDEDLTDDETIRKSFDFNCSYIEAIYHTLFQTNPVTISPGVSSAATTSGSNVKLPKVEIPKFTGDIKAFKPFLDMFQSLIHNNTSLSNIEKFNYLISSLRGPPLALVQTTPMSSANYNVAYDALLSRYDNKRLIAFAHLQEIDNAQSVKYSKNTQALRLLLDTFTENLAALKNMSLPVGEWDFILYYMFAKHLDQETITRFELENPIAANALPTFEKLKDFVQQRCNALDAIDFSLNKGSTTQPSSKYSQNYQSSPVQKNKQLSTYFTNSNKNISSPKITCSYCKRDHSIYKCSEYHNRSPQERYNFVKKNKLCINCLSVQHTLDKCRSAVTCNFCHGKHHSSVHINKNITVHNSSPSASSSQTNDQECVTTPETSTFAGMVSLNVLLSTAIVEVLDARNNYQKIRILLDSGSQTSYISEKCVKRLGLRRFDFSLSIKGLGSMSDVTSSGGVTCKIKPVGKLFPMFDVDAVILPKLCSKLPSSPINYSDWNHIHNIKLADKEFYKPAPIDMLLGADVFPQIIQDGRILGKENEPIAIKTFFGYIVMGKCPTDENQTSANYFTFFTLDDDTFAINNLIKRFWEIEEIPRVKTLAPEDVLCENIFVETHYRNECGRYVINLPFKSTEPTFNFQDIRNIALRRFYSLERRLLANVNLHKQYSEFLKEYIENDFMEEVTDEYDKSVIFKNIFYLPHHCVLKNSTTTKLRVVFDGSTKTSQGISLNETLLVGEKLQKDIFSILLKFRLHAIVFTADVKKMFLQILVDPKHQNYQRILWRFSPYDQVKDYRMKRLSFGLSSSPFIANRVILQLAADEHDNFPLAAQVLREDMYIDDVCSGASNLKEAKLLRDQVINILQKGNFELRKWTSNEKMLLDDIPISDRYDHAVSFEENDLSIKVLGLQWQPTLDLFSYTTDTEIRGYTKRQILSDIAKIFDPLGFLVPLTTFAKLIMQHLWTLGLSWDDLPPTELCHKWCQFKSSFSVLNNLEIPRRVLIDNFQSCEIHAFCDSSEKAYACVIYFRCEEKDSGFINTFFVCAKSKVAPLKSISVPRLELCAAALLADLLATVLQTFKGKINFSQIFAYSDSMITLHWIKSSPHKWKTFVSNRVTHIQNKISPAFWYHVASEDNPADCASRGLLPTELVENKLWFFGPQWLHLSKIHWPISQSFAPYKFTFEELEEKVITFTTISEPCFIEKLIQNCSVLSKIKRIVANVLRFIYNLKNSKNKRTEALTLLELNQSLLLIVKCDQQLHFKKEIESLKEKKSVPKFLRKLNAFLDNDGILRVGGRLTNSNLIYSRKYPAILPKNGRLTQMIIKDFHITYLHPGAQTLQFLISQQFWILSAKNSIKKVVSNCKSCWRLSPKSFQPPMGDLPSCRVSQMKAFSIVGLDYAGPFIISAGKLRGAKTAKAYICIFVCMATKCLHIELASDLTTEAFIAALRRFIARRGRCDLIISDCGSNFIGASKEISKLMKQAAEHITVTFKFNPPGSPHFAGMAEAAVKSVKTHIRRVIGEQKLTFEEFYTLLAQIEALLNSRPLCPLSNDPNDLSVLTPGHFLTLEPMSSLPDPDLTYIKPNRLNRWQLLQYLHQHFWKRWHHEYLHTLQQRSKWLDASHPIPLGTMVVIKNEQVTPLKWVLGRIEKLYFGKDGIARVADVRTKTGILKRALVKLCPLPSSDNI